MTATRDQVLEALATVPDPELGSDLVSLGMVGRVDAADGAARVTIQLPPAASGAAEGIGAAVRAALQGLDLPGGVDVALASDVPSTRMEDDGKSPGVRNVVAVASGKGGVGKSSVAVNLAAALARDGLRVGLLDVDIYGPSVPLMTGTAGAKPRVVEGRIETVAAHGLRVLSMGHMVPQDRALVWRGPMLHKAINQFFTDVDWGELDVLVLDLPPGTGDVQLSLAQVFPLTGAVLVTTPQPVAVADVVKGANMFDQVNVPVLGVVENMSTFACPCCGTETPIFSTGGGEAVCAERGWSFLGAIPIDPSVREGGDAGTPVVVSHPDAPVSLALRRTARALTGKIRQAAHGG